MVFGLNKCAVLVLKMGKMVRIEGIELPDGKHMREVNIDGYKYLRVLQLDSIMNREIKEKSKANTLRVKKLLRSKLNGGNVIAGMNTWTAGIIRYGAGVLDRTKEEFKTRKLMTMNRSLHLRGNLGRLYLAKKEGGSRLISCEECVYVEVQNLDKYLSESEEWMLTFVAGEKRLSDIYIYIYKPPLNRSITSTPLYLFTKA